MSGYLRAVATVTEMETQLNELFGRTVTTLLDRADRVFQLAQSGPTVARQAAAAPAADGAAAEPVSRLRSEASRLAAGRPATRAEVEAALSVARLVAELESSIQRAPISLSMVASHRATAVRANRMAAAAAELLRLLGETGREADLSARLRAATDRLREVMPPPRASGQGERDGLEWIAARRAPPPGDELEAAIHRTEEAARDVAAAVTGSWQSEVERIMATAGQLRDWLAGGDQQDEREQLRDDLKRLGPLLSAAEAVHAPVIGPVPPEPGRALEEIERVAAALDPILRLEAGLSDIARKAADIARQRETDLAGLARQALLLLPASEAGTMFHALRSARQAARLAVRQLPAPPASPTASSWEQAREAMAELTRFEDVITAVLAAATEQLPQRAAASRQSAQLLQATLPDPGAQGYGLTSLWQAVVAPGAGDESSADLTVAMNAVLTRTAKVTALEAATTRTLARVSNEVRNRAAVATDRAEAARELLPHSGAGEGRLRLELDNALAAARSAGDGLPDRGRLPRSAEELAAIASVRRSAAALEKVTEDVLSKVGPALDRVRHDSQEVQQARAAVAAARELLMYTGRHQAELSARLDVAAGRLSVPPSTAPVTAQDIRAIARALDQRPDLAAATDAVTSVLAHAHQLPPSRPAEIAARADLLRKLLSHSGERLARLGDQINAAEAAGTAPWQDRPATLAGIEAASRDIERTVAAEEKLAELTRVIATISLKRLSEAGRLAEAARDLLRHVQPPDKDQLEQALATAVPPVPAVLGQPATITELTAIDGALGHFDALQRASSAVLTKAAAKLEDAWEQASTARRQAADVRALLAFTGTARDDLSRRLGQPEGRLHLLSPRRWQPRQPGLVTVADLQSVGRALDGGVAEQLRWVARDFDAAASATTAAVKRTWTAADRSARAVARITLAAADRADDEETAQRLRETLGSLQDALRELGQAPAGTEQVPDAGRRRAALRNAVSAVDATAWRRAYLLLGSDPEIRDPRFRVARVSRAIAVADALTRRADLAGQPDRSRFAWLSRQVGLDHRDSLLAMPVFQAGIPPAAAMTRLLRFLLLADEVFGDGSAAPNPAGLLEEVTNLRRAADIIVASRGTAAGEATAAELGTEALRYVAAPPSAAAPAQPIRDLATLVGRVKEAKREAAKGLPGLPGAAQVSRADLAAFAQMTERVRQAQAHLEGDVDLTTGQREALIWRLLNGVITDEARMAVVDLLRTIPRAELGQVIGWRLVRRLTRVFPLGHRRRAELDRFVTQRYGAGVALHRLHRAGVPVDRPFSPAMLSESLTGLEAGEDLTVAQFGDAIAAIKGRSAVAYVRELALSRRPGPGDGPSEYDKGLDYVRRLREAEERRTQITQYQGEMVNLDQAQLVDLLKAALYGLARFQFRDALSHVDPATLTAIRDELAPVVEQRIPVGSPLHAEIDEILQASIDPHTREPYSHLPARVPFTLDLISKELGDIRPSDPEELTRAEWIAIGREVAGRDDVQIRATLPALDQRAWKHLLRWLGDVAAPARQVHLAQQYLTAASWQARLSFARRRVLIARRRVLISGTLVNEGLAHSRAAWQALELLRDMNAVELAQMFPEGATGALWELLAGQLPAADMEDLRTTRFDTENGKVRQDVRHGLPFTLDQVSESLRGIRPGQELGVEQVLVAASDSEGRWEKILSDLDETERRWGKAFLDDLRETLIDLAVRRLSGHPGYQISPAALAQLVGHLLAGSVTDRVRRVLISTLRTADASELSAIYRPGLRARLERAIPDDPLRRDLEQVFTERIAANDSVRMDVQPAAPFRWELVDTHLSSTVVKVTKEAPVPWTVFDVVYRPRRGDEMTPGAVDTVHAAAKRIIGELRALPPQQRAVAAWEITAVAANLLQFKGTSDWAATADARILDAVLSYLYRDQVQQAPDAQWIRDLTSVPPASQAPQLEKLFGAREEETLPLGREVSGEAPALRVDLVRALRQEIDRLYDVHVRHADSRNRYDLQGDVRPLAELAEEWLREALGPLAPAPGRATVADPGNDGLIYDLLAYRAWERRGWSAGKKRGYARRLLTLSPEYATVQEILLGRNDGSSESGGSDDILHVPNDVIDDLLQDQGIVDRIIEVYNHKNNKVDFAEPEGPGLKLLIPTFREQADGEEQVAGYKLARKILEGLWNTQAHEDFVASVTADKYLGLVLRAGLANMLTGWTLHHIQRSLDSGQAERGSAGRSSSMPRLPEARPLISGNANLALLVHQAGFWNVAAAFLFGDVAKLAGPGLSQRPSLLFADNFTIDSRRELPPAAP
jgi:hypothetical protein